MDKMHHKKNQTVRQEVKVEQGVSTESANQSAVESLIKEASLLVEKFDSEFSIFNSRLDELLKSLKQNILYLAVVGQFKRGKSTFINALIGEPILPVSVLPVTSIPTFVKFESTRKVRIFFKDESSIEYPASTADEMRDLLSRYVTESGNPENRKGVVYVEVLHPAPILKKAVVLIDTPGIGSTFKHNTETTINFLSQCDATIFLLSADPPITEVEIEFLRLVQEKVSHLFFVVNKADYLTDEEQQQTLEFLKMTLKDISGIDKNIPVFLTSAKTGLAGKQTGNISQWKASGMAEIEKFLVQFLLNQKITVLTHATVKNLKNLVDGMISNMELKVKSFQMPVEQLEEKLKIFDLKLAQIEKEKLATTDLLTGDQKRIHDFLEEYSNTLCENARKYFDAIFNKNIAKANDDVLDDILKNELLAFFQQEMHRATTLFNEKIDSVIQQHKQKIDNLIESLSQVAGDLFDVSYNFSDDTDIFKVAHQPYWVTHQWITTPGVLSYEGFERILPGKIRQRRKIQKLKDHLEFLIIQNVENLRWAIFQSIDLAFARFSAAIDERFSHIIASTHSAIKEVLRRRQQQSDTVREEISRYCQAIDEVKRIQQAILSYEKAYRNQNQ